MYPNPNPLRPVAQQKTIDALVPCLADLLDLAGSAKLAHWHVRGLQFVALHKLFDDFHDVLSSQADRIAERVAISIGGEVLGTARQVAEESRLDDFPVKERGAEPLCKALLDGAREISAGLQDARKVCEAAGDIDTANLIQDVALAVELSAGFIAAHLM